MDFKKVLVSFLAIASLLLLTATVSAAALTTTQTVNVNDQLVSVTLPLASSISVNAGDTITAKVQFTAVDFGVADGKAIHASNVRVKVELEGSEGDVTAVTPYFDMQSGKTYVKTLTLKVPQVDKNAVSEDMTLNVRIWNSDYDEATLSGLLNVQRTPYTSDFMSVSADSTVKAGALFPVEIVVKNTGYNNLEDMYVTAKISALGVEKKVFLGDLLNVVNENSDNPDTVSGKIYLQVPYSAVAGKYLVEVTAANADTSSTDAVEITVQNDFPEQVVKTSTGLLLVNPTNDLKMYKVALPTGEQIVSVQAGSSASVDVKAQTEDYVVSVTTLSGEVVGNFTFKASEQPTASIAGNPITVLTVILGIVFFVLLVVLVVLLSKKPQKSEELGESYY